jgi:hypothetical protein
MASAESNFRLAMERSDMTHEVGRRQPERSGDGLTGRSAGQSNAGGVRQPRLRTENGLSSPLGGVDGAELPLPIGKLLLAIILVVPRQGQRNL